MQRVSRVSLRIGEWYGGEHRARIHIIPCNQSFTSLARSLAGTERARYNLAETNRKWPNYRSFRRHAGGWENKKNVKKRKERSELSFPTSGNDPDASNCAITEYMIQTLPGNSILIEVHDLEYLMRHVLDEISLFRIIWMTLTFLLTISMFDYKISITVDG